MHGCIFKIVFKLSIYIELWDIVNINNTWNIKKADNNAGLFTKSRWFTEEQSDKLSVKWIRDRL